jgi:hypothetical protein
MLVPKGGLMLKKTVVAVVLLLSAAPARADTRYITTGHWMAETEARRTLDKNDPAVRRWDAMMASIKARINPIQGAEPYTKIVEAVFLLKHRFETTGHTVTLFEAAMFLEARLPKQGKVGLWTKVQEAWKEIK